MLQYTVKCKIFGTIRRLRQNQAFLAKLSKASLVCPEKSALVNTFNHPCRVTPDILAKSYIFFRTSWYFVWFVTFLLHLYAFLYHGVILWQILCSFSVTNRLMQLPNIEEGIRTKLVTNFINKNILFYHNLSFPVSSLH